MNGVMRAIGLMSGTSMDGIDVALIETDGANHVRRGPSETYAYPASFQSRLRQALEDATAITDRGERPGILQLVEAELTERHAEAVLRFIGDRALQPSAIDLIGFHGQTVLHRPDQRLTVQLGDGQMLARLIGIDVVHDLRAADCAAGGQGAPLAPVYHRALVAHLPQRPIAVLNVGGVANVTWIGADGQLIAFDTGPGNALIDDWMRRHSNASQDTGGETAGRGDVDDTVLHQLLLSPYLSRVPPKSLDRNSFSPAPVAGLSFADGAATLTAFTARTAAAARQHFPEEPALWIVCGGGRHNRTLMRLLAELVENAVVPAEAVGLDGDSLEAEAWAYLAVRSRLGLPISYPGTTGVSAPMLGGLFAAAP